jgi:hypothetical protein
MSAPDWLGGLGGGALIGFAVVLLIALIGRIAGVSGIVGGVLSGQGDLAWRVAFLAGLPLGAGLYAAAMGDLAQELQVGWGAMAVAGLLVGFGTRLGSGCTSGHGICGLARLSPRSAAATVTFIASGMLTVFVLRHVVT